MDALRLTGNQAQRLGNGGSGRIENGHRLPTWLLREPLPLATQADHPHFHGPLQLLAGPDRLECGWWTATDDAAGAAAPVAGRATAGPALRDYFIAHDERAGLLWVYRERLRRAGTAATASSDGCWFLQGVYA